MDDIIVSISVLSYKHGPYVRQCLDSLLAQKVNFRYEIVVGEDFSNDGTREILLEYKEKYPDIFTLLLNDENMGAARNNHNIKLHCRSKYIATCESDDFWVDENKLQKQVDFLEAHPEYVAVASNSVKVDHNGKHPFCVLQPWQLNRRYRLKDFLSNSVLIQGSSMLHRNIIPYRDEKYVKLRLAEPTMGDLLTRVLLYDYGDIYVTSDITHAHRHGDATPTSFSYQQATKALDYTRMYFRIVDNLTEYFDGKYDLSSLKAVRMGVMISYYQTKQYKIDKNELKDLWLTLPPKLRTMSVYFAVKKLGYRLVHKLMRRINKPKITL